ncbi:MAG: hypothetical protein PHD95_02610 [Candidatus ainarchaeum sp.]|nr:hypothetical protein [Candidatus ainarchaeum sp.]
MRLPKDKRAVLTAMFQKGKTAKWTDKRIATCRVVRHLSVLLAEHLSAFEYIIASC